LRFDQVLIKDLMAVIDLEGYGYRDFRNMGFAQGELGMT
jgi:hypothetical protein